ncbi:hypothetical protein ACMA1I_20580 [Pontibacter sp. 13R65]|uniref:hypothetical protein n=1 Tax=Pontibacter sp. 13R65 TaxID=3127458 RepID=UPI00301C7AA6
MVLLIQEPIKDDATGCVKKTIYPIAGIAGHEPRKDNFEGNCEIKHRKSYLVPGKADLGTIQAAQHKQGNGEHQRHAE